MSFIDDPDKLTEKVKKMMKLGYAPSEIDAKFGLKPGAAHDIVVAEWARGRCASAVDEDYDW